MKTEGQKEVEIKYMLEDEEIQQKPTIPWQDCLANLLDAARTVAHLRRDLTEDELGAILKDSSSWVDEVAEGLVEIGDGKARRIANWLDTFGLEKER